MCTLDQLREIGYKIYIHVWYEIYRKKTLRKLCYMILISWIFVVSMYRFAKVLTSFTLCWKLYSNWNFVWWSFDVINDQCYHITPFSVYYSVSLNLIMESRNGVCNFYPNMFVNWSTCLIYITSWIFSCYPLTPFITDSVANKISYGRRMTKDMFW